VRFGQSDLLNWTVLGCETGGGASLAHPYKAGNSLTGSLSKNRILDFDAAPYDMGTLGDKPCAKCALIAIFMTNILVHRLFVRIQPNDRSMERSNSYHENAG